MGGAPAGRWGGVGKRGGYRSIVRAFMCSLSKGTGCLYKRCERASECKHLAISPMTHFTNDSFQMLASRCKLLEDANPSTRPYCKGISECSYFVSRRRFRRTRVLETTKSLFCNKRPLPPFSSVCS